MGALQAYIEPTTYKGKIINNFSVKVTYYDLLSRNCELYIKIASNIGENTGVFFTETWKVPEIVLQNWGIDDTILLQAYADEKEFTIISFEQ
jgi:hypothetical protein